MKHVRRKTWLIISICVLFAIGLAGGIAFGGDYLVSYAIGRSGDGGNRKIAQASGSASSANTGKPVKESGGTQSGQAAASPAALPEETVSVTSADGLRLNGIVHAQPEESHQWAIVVHGYRSDHRSVAQYARGYHAAGYQVLTPDLRACGSSEGDFIGMGWLDRQDMLLWIDWILSRDAGARIILHGISMGAATVMMTAGEPVPDAVTAYVEDCGYTSVWDIFASELKLRFRLPPFPLLNAASIVSSLRAGYDFSQASAVTQLAKCEKPMLFIHGDQDDFVPFSMLQPLYDAKPGQNKQMLVAPGAGHAQSLSVLGQAYWDTVFSFLAEYGMQ